MFLKELEGVWMNLIGVAFKTSQISSLVEEKSWLAPVWSFLLVWRVTPHRIWLNSYQSQIGSMMGQWEKNP